LKNSKYPAFYQKMILSGEISPKKIAELIGNNCTADHIRSVKQRLLRPEKCKKHKDRWRKNNSNKIRESRKKYRNPSREFAVNKGNQYTLSEDLIILSKEKTTAKIAKSLGRSIDAIYRRRVRLHKKTQNL